MAIAVDWARPSKPHIKQKIKEIIYLQHIANIVTPLTCKSGRNHIKWWKITDMTITVDWDIEQEINETKSNLLSFHLINFNSLPWLIQNSLQFKGSAVAWWRIIRLRIERSCVRFLLPAPSCVLEQNTITPKMLVNTSETVGSS